MIYPPHPPAINSEVLFFALFKVGASGTETETALTEPRSSHHLLHLQSPNYRIGSVTCLLKRIPETSEIWKPGGFSHHSCKWGEKGLKAFCAARVRNKILGGIIILSRWKRGIALYVQEKQECMEVCVQRDDEQAETLWVRAGKQSSKGKVILQLSAAGCLIRKT